MPTSTRDKSLPPLLFFRVGGPPGLPFSALPYIAPLLREVKIFRGFLYMYMCMLLSRIYSSIYTNTRIWFRTSELVCKSTASCTNNSCRCRALASLTPQSGPYIHQRHILLLFFFLFTSSKLLLYMSFGIFDLFVFLVARTTPAPRPTPFPWTTPIGVRARFFSGCRRVNIAIACQPMRQADIAGGV